MSLRIPIGVAVMMGCSAAAGRAETPKVESLFPAGGQRGTEFEVIASGKLDPWPVQAVCDAEGVVFSPGEKEGRYRVSIAAGTEPGGVLVRFYNAEGATAPRQFMVGTEPERPESVAETTMTSADFPLTINGKLGSGGEIDQFPIELSPGQRLVADVAAYSLDSPLDPILHLRGLRGEQLAFNHDATRLGLDPRLDFTAPEMGTYELHLAAFAYPPRADIRFTGGDSAIYRLTLRNEFPEFDLPPPHEAKGQPAQSIELPAEISGTIEPAGDVDRYRFAAEQNQRVRIEVAAAALGSWMDPVVTIIDGDGKELKSDDDVDQKTNPDVDLAWTVPSDGHFLAEVRDLNGNGGPEIAYRIRFTGPVPSFSASAIGGVYSVAPGKTAEVEIKVARLNGYEGDLEVGAEGLPPGVTAGPVAVNDKGEAKLLISAAAETPPANAPFTLWAGPTGQPNQRVLGHFELKGATTDPGDLLVNETKRGWLTVTSAK